jgi:uncharacterized protein
MPQFIYILRLTEKFTNSANWTDETNAIVMAHFNYIKDLHSKGISKFVGRVNAEPENPDLFGINVLDVDDEKTAQSIMDNDPTIIGGVMGGKLLPFNIVFS